MRVPRMTTPKASRDDDSEALHWLKMARRVLSGEIDPHNARAVLSARGKARQTAHPAALADPALAYRQSRQTNVARMRELSMSSSITVSTTMMICAAVSA